MLGNKKHTPSSSSPWFPRGSPALSVPPASHQEYNPLLRSLILHLTFPKLTKNINGAAGGKKIGYGVKMLVYTTQSLNKPFFAEQKRKMAPQAKKKIRGTVPLRAQRAENFCYHREKVTFFPPLLQQKNFFLGFRSGPPPNLRQKNTFSRHCYKKKVFSRILA